MKEKLAKLIDVKSIVTLVMTAVFSYLAITKVITGQEFLTIFTVSFPSTLAHSIKKTQTRMVLMIKGIDISAHQVPSKIDYDKLSKEIDFAILRVGYTGYGINPPHSNNFNKDVHFETHYKELAKRGVDIGVYYYGGAINEYEVTRELKNR